MTDWFIPRFQLPPPQRTVLVVVRHEDDTKRCLRAMQAMQYQRVCEMEDELAEARRELADTSRRMNQMAAEINKSTDCG